MFCNVLHNVVLIVVGHGRHSVYVGLLVFLIYYILVSNKTILTKEPYSIFVSNYLVKREFSILFTSK
jgi:hypothetical protein